jgi:hypothetical protein
MERRSCERIREKRGRRKGKEREGKEESAGAGEAAKRKITRITTTRKKKEKAGEKGREKKKKKEFEIFFKKKQGTCGGKRTLSPPAPKMTREDASSLSCFCQKGSN